MTLRDRENALFPRQLLLTLDADGVRGIILAVRLNLLPIEDVIRADVDQLRAFAFAHLCEDARRLRV